MKTHEITTEKMSESPNKLLDDLESIFEKMHSEGHRTDTSYGDKNVLITTQEGDITYIITIPQDDDEEVEKDVRMPNLDDIGESKDVLSKPSLHDEEGESTQSAQKVPIDLDDPTGGDGQQLKLTVDENGQFLQLDNHILTTDAEGNQILVQGTDQKQLQHLLQSFGVDGGQMLVQLQGNDEKIYGEGTQLQMIAGDDQGQMILVQGTDGEQQLIDASMLQTEDGNLVLRQDEDGQTHLATADGTPVSVLFSGEGGENHITMTIASGHEEGQQIFMEQQVEEGQEQFSVQDDDSEFLNYCRLMNFEESKIPENKKTTEAEMNFSYTDIQRQKSKPFWTKKKAQHSKASYQNLYKRVLNQNSPFMAVNHSTTEDDGFKFHFVIFVPDNFDSSITDTFKLYAHHQLVVNNCEELIPKYLNFMKGVVDSEDLPLNISREMLQQNKILKVIRKNLVKKCMELFEELTEDKKGYKKFYSQFSNNLKLGINEDSTNRAKLVDLLCFQTSASGDDMCSLGEYVGRMKEAQKSIYFITGKSKEQVSNSAFVERVKLRGFEVIYMTEPIDEHVIQQIKEYQGKQLVCVTKEGLDLPQKKRKQNFEVTKAGEIQLKKIYNLSGKYSKKNK
jgi:Hsp90 protein